MIVHPRWRSTSKPAPATWSIGTATAIATNATHLNFIEEPFSPEDHDGYRELAEQTDTRIACGAQVAAQRPFRLLNDRERLAVLQADLTRCGGLSAALVKEALKRMEGCLQAPSAPALG